MLQNLNQRNGYLLFCEIWLNQWQVLELRPFLKIKPISSLFMCWRLDRFEEHFVVLWEWITLKKLNLYAKSLTTCLINRRKWKLDTLSVTFILTQIGHDLALTNQILIISRTQSTMAKQVRKLTLWINQNTNSFLLWRLLRWLKLNTLYPLLVKFTKKKKKNRARLRTNLMIVGLLDQIETIIFIEDMITSTIDMITVDMMTIDETIEDIMTIGIEEITTN